MPWVKLTDDWYDDPAIASCDDHGIAMWVIGLSWCARNLTDGKIPAAMVRRFTTEADSPSIAGALVALGLWSVIDTGYLVENYHRYQPPRAEVLAGREAERERSKRRRAESGDRPSGDRPVSMVETGNRPDPPVPVPVPPVVVVSPTGRDASQHRDDNDQTYRGLDLHHVWQRIAGWKADAKTQRPNARWLKSVARNQPNDEHPDGGTYAERARAVLDCWAIDDPTTLAEVLYGRRQLTHVPRRLSA